MFINERFILASWSYLVMPFMGTDLGKVMKMQRLSEEKIQYLVYQMLKGLKVLGLCIIYIIGIWIWWLKLFFFLLYSIFILLV